MKPLWINGINGLYNELYTPDTRSMAAQDISVQDNLLDLGLYFWRSLLQERSVVGILDQLEENIHCKENQRPQFLAILQNKTQFIQKVLNARVKICDQSLSPRQLFNEIETLSILCELFSRFRFSPFNLTIQDGFVFNEISSKDIIEKSLNHTKNPCLSFIKENILPVIHAYSPDVLFCSGRVTYSQIACAVLVKRSAHKTHICVTRHSSEYYALNKIDGLLQKNDTLFSVVDSVILERFGETEKNLLECLAGNRPLSSVPNIIYKNSLNKITKTEYMPPSLETMPRIVKRPEQLDGLTVSPAEVFDVHLTPNTKCFWNKCSFCGINQKYTHEYRLDGENELEFKLDHISKNIPDKSFVWFIDEALPASQLRTIAEYFVRNRNEYMWQVCSRIDESLIERGLPEALAKSGLKEMRLGLESASYTVLRLMEKFDDRFSLELVEEIVKEYSAKGISIHFPIIIGFPGEEKVDRQKTYDFLTGILQPSQAVTFNINIFGLDVTSRVFKRWPQYNISKVSLPCPPIFFLGNIATWEGTSKESDGLLDIERNNFMRDKLYPWMPPNAFTKPTTFYRLSETIRDTLIWKSVHFEDLINSSLAYAADRCIRKADFLTYCEKENGMTLIYNWETHHYLEGNQFFANVLKTWDYPQSILDGIRRLEGVDPELYKKKDLAILINKLISHGYLILATDDKAPTTRREMVKSFYDAMYFFEEYPYTITPDSFLTENRHLLKGGVALEIGIGTGKNIAGLLEMGYEIHGVDLSAVAVENLKKKHHDDRCVFEVADICDMPIAESCYSLVVCSLVLSHLDDQELVS